MSQASLFQEEAQSNAPPQNAKRVLVPYPVDKAYDYIVPDDLALEAGDYVCVPLSGREVPGVVWGDAAGDVKPGKLKAVVSKYGLKPMPQIQRDFIDWLSHYTMNAKGAVLKMSLSVPGALNPPKPATGYRKVLSPRGEDLGEGGKTHKFTEEQKKRARELRLSQTDAEKTFWMFVRNRRFLDLKFRRQVPVGSYVVDFLCKEKSLIVELDGGQHAEQADYDADRTKYLEKQGYKVIRFWNNEILENLEGCAEKLVSLMPPSPNPLPGGERALPPKQQAVIDALQDGQAYRAAEIAKMAGCSAGVVKTMAGKGLLEETEIYNPAPCRKPDPHRDGPKLSADQQQAADHLRDYIMQGGYHAALLDGVTGAGKTEVYFEAVAEALKADKQVLILLPEIALSNAFLKRFQQRFGCAPALWHSHLSTGARKTTWRGVAEGHSKVVVGARSALMLPYQDLGLIIVDEEHDPAYKQEDGVIYHARDMAVVRAHLAQIPVVLVSATPSLETMHNAWNGRYDHLHLPDRFGGARLPEIEAIDMRSDKPERGEFISPPLRNAVRETVQRGEQALLFLNRRGYAPLTLCRTCGHRMECPRCTAWLVEHRAGGNLQCHHCGFSMRPPSNCPECDDKDSLHACGPGVERIHEEVKHYFPDARVMVLASDTADNNDKLREMLDQIRDHKVDIIVGTQIIAKGHHFPNLTCVGVIDADLGLQGGELRAAERTYQLLHQVAGRAGREEKKGQVYLQTFMPDHRIMQALAHGARDQFLEVEAHEREAARMPPYSRLAGIIIAGREESQVIEVAKELGKTAPQGPEIQTLGPAPAPFARLRGKYRYRLLVRADKKIDLQKAIAAWVAQVKPPSTVRIYIDIDPQSFL